MSDEVERTLCQLPHVHVFRIPTRKSAEGHRASDFPKDPVWTGKCKIVAKGRVAGVILVDAKNDVFAHCVVNDDGAVERTLDSGRYFVLRITNPQGRHAFIGIAFNERNDAFDFNVALSEFKREQEREDMAAQMADVPVGQMRDMSLKEGEKIKIKINRKKHVDPDFDPDAVPAGNQARGLGGMLSPPPFKSGTHPTPTSDPFGADPFGSDPFGSDPFSSSPSPSTAFSSSPAPASVFGFADDPFSSPHTPSSTPSSAFPSSNTSDPFASSDPFSSDPFGAFFAPASKPSGGSGGSANLLDF
mmetsp:Transcript_15572/g.34408  ORF Transcript_15572/g.34408 Transcript_15572/m.34408 type:complete len:302 (+) Transcript_15572:169-1074(+)